LTKNGFAPSQHFDNARLPDWTKGHKERKSLQNQHGMMARTTLRNTGDNFMSEKNAFRTNLQD
jgi:hypothetical protein